MADSEARPTVDVKAAVGGWPYPWPNVAETQALRRTVNYRLTIENGEVTTISVSRPFGALVLKAAAYVTDSRDPERHLFDAAVLLACIDNPHAEREGFAGSDRSRLLVLDRELVEGHHAWLRMPVDSARRGQAVLRALCAVGDVG